MRDLALLTASLLLCGSTARAASFDCAKASTTVEKTICADSALSNADDRLADAFSSVMDATLRPNSLRSEQIKWLSARDKLTDAPALLKSYQSRIDELTAAARKWQATARTISPEHARQSCLVPPDAPYDLPCRVDEFGDVQGEPSLRYQLQSYKDGEVRMAGGVAVFRTVGPGLVPMADVAVDTAHFAPPEIVRSPAGRLLVVRGSIEGTGNFNADQVYLHGDARLAEIDVVSWLDDLPPRLPKGWGAWKGIYPNYKTFTAETPLWQDGDGNCCPTAGRAVIRLGLNDRRLVIEDVKIFKGADEAGR
jgi:uncharacterized protein YecT (DUF1311 family)